MDLDFDELLQGPPEAYHPKPLNIKHKKIVVVAEPVKKVKKTSLKKTKQKKVPKPHTPSKNAPKKTKKKASSAWIVKASSDYKPKDNPGILLGSLFSGLETPSIALQQAGIHSTVHFAVEENEHLRKFIYQRFQPRELHGDVREVDFTKLPECEILTGGPPCQPFCEGGKNRALEDVRGPLVFSLVELCEARAKASLPLPRAVVMEQAKTLLGQHKSIYKEIKHRFKALGFRVKAKVVTTSEHGISQNRQRAYVVAWKEIEGRRFSFPRPLAVTVPMNHMLKGKRGAVDVSSCASKSNKRNISQVTWREDNSQIHFSLDPRPKYILAQTLDPYLLLSPKFPNPSWPRLCRRSKPRA